MAELAPDAVLCPACGGEELGVYDTRRAADGTIRRTRECVACATRITTRERVVPPRAHRQRFVVRSTKAKNVRAALEGAIDRMGETAHG